MKSKEMSCLNMTWHKSELLNLGGNLFLVTRQSYLCCGKNFQIIQIFCLPISMTLCHLSNMMTEPKKTQLKIANGSVSLSMVEKVLEFFRAKTIQVTANSLRPQKEICKMIRLMVLEIKSNLVVMSTSFTTNCQLLKVELSKQAHGSSWVSLLALISEKAKKVQILLTRILFYLIELSWEKTKISTKNITTFSS